jgi:hypothetical protein
VTATQQPRNAILLKPKTAKLRIPDSCTSHELDRTTTLSMAFKRLDQIVTSIVTRRLLDDPVVLHALGQLTIYLATRALPFIEHHDTQASSSQSHRRSHASWTCADDTDVSFDDGIELGRICAGHDLPPRPTIMPGLTNVVHDRTATPSTWTRQS